MIKERNERAAALKSKGNAAYTQRQFSKAAQLYTQAIEITYKPEAVYWSNRAACLYSVSALYCQRTQSLCRLHELFPADVGPGGGGL
jgi:tetratricopeptide (TPR) repeat protein